MPQMTLFDTVEPTNNPRFSAGDPIYEVCLDAIESYVVSRTFASRVDVFGDKVEAGHTLWRYILDRTGRGGHSSFSEYEMGQKWFSSLRDAEMRADLNKGAIEKNRLVVRGDSLRISEAVAFHTVRHLDGHVLVSQAARIGDTVVFEQKSCCYPFLKVFETESKASRHFRALVKEIKEEAEEAGGKPVDFVSCDMYKVSDKLWSNFEYAERHGDWSCLEGDASRQGERDMSAKLLSERKKSKGRER